MAAKHLQFFSVPNEFLEILKDILFKERVRIFLYQYKERPQIKESELSAFLDDVRALGVKRLFLAPIDLKYGLTDQDIASDRLPLIMLDLPYMQKGTLFMGELSIRTNWLDTTSSSLLRTDRTTLQLYDRIVKEFKKHLCSPILAENIVTKKSAMYRNIAYTKLAERFADDGGNLQQPNVQNVRYKIPKETTKDQA